MIFSAVGWSLLLCDFSATARSQKRKQSPGQRASSKAESCTCTDEWKIRHTHTGDNKALQLELF